MSTPDRTSPSSDSDISSPPDTLARDLRAIKMGGRGIHRIERSGLEAFIQRSYDETARGIAEHPFEEEDAPSGVDAASGRPPSLPQPDAAPTLSDTTARGELIRPLVSGNGYLSS